MVSKLPEQTAFEVYFVGFAYVAVVWRGCCSLLCSSQWEWMSIRLLRSR